MRKPGKFLIGFSFSKTFLKKTEQLSILIELRKERSNSSGFGTVLFALLELLFDASYNTLRQVLSSPTSLHPIGNKTKVQRGQRFCLKSNTIKWPNLNLSLGLPASVSAFLIIMLHWKRRMEVGVEKWHSPPYPNTDINYNPGKNH